jgi:hypothetical protein
MGGLSTFSPRAALKRRSFFNGANVILPVEREKVRSVPQKIAQHDPATVKQAVQCAWNTELRWIDG